MTDTMQWHEMEPLGPQDEGDIGGDIQVGTAWGRRFGRQLPSGNWALITDSFYTVYDRLHVPDDWDGKPNGIQNQVEFMVCADPTDPGGTEIDCDYLYDEVEVAYPDELNDDTTRRLCERLSLGDYNWRPEEDGF